MLTEADKETRASAAQALHNLVYNSSDDRKVKREIRILKLLELIRSYADRRWDAIMHHLHHHDQEIDNRLPILLDGNFFLFFTIPFLCITNCYVSKLI